MEKSELRETMECYLFCFGMLFLFFGSILLASPVSLRDVITYFSSNLDPYISTTVQPVLFTSVIYYIHRFMLKIVRSARINDGI